MGVRACRRGPKMLPLATVKRFEVEAARKGVSKVARSRRGFLPAYKKGALDPEWCARRAAFIKRHMAQVKRRGESLCENGAPTRRHLALIMWAYSPRLCRR